MSALRRSALTLKLTLAIMAAAFVPVHAAQAARSDPPTWSDEFDGPVLDPSRWSHRATGARHDGILTPEAVSVGGGVLTIRTYTEGGQHYSGMISTARSGLAGFEQTYGYFEARMKFNSAPGQWSAFWLQSPTIGSPLGNPRTAGVEMDIVEHRARCVNAPPPAAPTTCSPTSDVSDRVQHGLIWDGYGPESKASLKLSDQLLGLGNDSWHTFALRWTPTALTFFYDDVAIWVATSPISQRSEYVILSSEVAAFFAGAIPENGYGSRATSTTNMQVDYVRAWASPTPPAAAPTPGAPGPATPGAPGAADTTAPKATLVGRTSRTVGPTTAVRISCPDEACLATASGTVRVPRVGRVRARTYALRAKTTQIVQGDRDTVQLALPRAARIAIRRALRARKRVVLTLNVRAADAAGNVRRLTRRVALRR